MPDHLEPEPAEEVYRRLMDLHQQLFAEQRLEAGYHVLAAALHVAEELDSLERLRAIGQMAEDHQSEIDRTQPNHRLSSTFARKHRGLPQFRILVEIAKAAAARIKASATLERSREHH